MAVITSRCGGRRPWPAARPAARRRTGAARRRPPGRGRRSPPPPGAARGCRRRCRPRPPATSRSARRRAAAPCEPVTSATRVPCSGRRAGRARPAAPSSRRDRAVVLAASTSVGASRAAWPPASTTWSIARSATTVLPEPTSPCSSRCIGCARGQVGGDLLPDRRAARRSARTAAARRTRRAARRRRGGAGRAGHAGRAGAALGQLELDGEGLVPLQPLLRPPRPPRVRPVDRPQRRAQRRAVAARRGPRPAADPAAGRAMSSTSRTHWRSPRTAARRGRVDRDQRAGELLGVTVAVVVEQDVLRAVELALAAELGRPSGEQPPPAGRRSRCAPAPG